MIREDRKKKKRRKIGLYLLLVLLLVAADCNLVACLKLVVELSYHSSVHGNATTLQRCLQLGAALAHVIDEIFEQGSVLFTLITRLSPPCVLYVLFVLRIYFEFI